MTRQERLRTAMRKRKLNCAQLAELLDRQPQTVRLWHCGKRPVPDYALATLELP